MRIARGPRPWTIQLFALLVTAQGLVAYVRGLSLLEVRQIDLELRYPFFDWNTDWVIDCLSAWLTIKLIPVVGVWVFANRWAR